MGKEKLSEQLSFRVPPSLYRAVMEIADADRRKLSEVALALLERGVAAYQRDGSLFEKQGALSSNGLTPPSFPQSDVRPEQMHMSNPDESKKRPGSRLSRVEREDLERAKDIIRERRKRDKQRSD